VSSLADRLRDVLLGARAGLVATALMSLLMVAARAAGLTGRLPPARITDKATEMMAPQDRPDRGDRDALATLLHFGFGAAAGAVFGVGASGVRRIGLASAIGVVYGTALYMVSYLGWVPALDIMPTATQDRPGRSITMLVAHWIYGASLGALTALGSQRRKSAKEVKRRFG
jgi:uncharacterized membrane protein YedE/YeeE